MPRDRSEGGGFFIVWRSVRESPFHFTKERRAATRYEAREDLWASATHRDEEVMSRGQLVTLRRGQILTSVLSLADRWRWKRDRVRTFLALLERMGELTVESTTQRAILTVCNYSKWQDVSPTNGAADPQRTRSVNPTTGHVQQSEPSNHLTKSPLHYPTIDGEFDAFWTAWPKKVGKAAARKAWDRLNGNRPEIDHVLEAIRWQAHTDQWRREDGRFIPNPATWINQNRWLDEPTKVEKEVPWGPIIVND